MSAAPTVRTQAKRAGIIFDFIQRTSSGGAIESGSFQSLSPTICSAFPGDFGVINFMKTVERFLEPHTNMPVIVENSFKSFDRETYESNKIKFAILFFLTKLLGRYRCYISHKVYR